MYAARPAGKPDPKFVSPPLPFPDARDIVAGDRRVNQRCRRVQVPAAGLLMLHGSEGQIGIFGKNHGRRYSQKKRAADGMCDGVVTRIDSGEVNAVLGCASAG